MAKEPLFNTFIEEQGHRLFMAAKEAEKVMTPPLGMGRVSPREFRERFPHIGKEERRAVRLRLAKQNKDPMDPSGSRALMAMFDLGGGDAS